MNDKVSKIRAILDAGDPSPQVSVRDFLWWFHAQRRGYWIVRSIRSDLKEASLRTVPNFEHAWIDGMIEFEKTDTKNSAADIIVQDEVPPEDTLEGAASGFETPEAVWVSREAAYRVSRLAAANRQIVSVNPEDLLPQIITKMMSGGYSQVPVMTNERTVRGMVSWQSIGSHLAMNVTGRSASDFSEVHHEIADDRSIFDAIPIIVANDYVLVRDSTNKISGIVTASDLSLQFRELTEPFLLLGEIENLVRNLIGRNFEVSELREACDERDPIRIGAVETVAHLSFGEYIRLLQNPDRWFKLDLAVDRVSFCDSLDKVRIIRNEVMHFDPDGITDDDTKSLRDFTRFLQQLAKITGKYQI